ncbi:hypothetical protein SK128_016338, partial [Halocaridina rubra]
QISCHDPMIPDALYASTLNFPTSGVSMASAHEDTFPFTLYSPLLGMGGANHLLASSLGRGQGCDVRLGS